MRNLDEHSGAIASLGIAAACATVREIDQDLNSLLNDLMALFAANAGDKAHAAGIMLVRGMIKTLRRRQTVICLPAFQKSLREKSRWSFLGRETGKTIYALTAIRKALSIGKAVVRISELPTTNGQQPTTGF